MEIATVATTETNVALQVQTLKQAAQPLMEGLAGLQLATKQLAVTDDDTYREGRRLYDFAASREKAVIDHWGPMCQAASNFHKSLTSIRAEMAKPWGTIKEAVAALTQRYADAQLAAQRELERRLAYEAEQQRRKIESEAADALGQGNVERSLDLQRQAQMTALPTLPSALPTDANTRMGTEFVPEVVDLIGFLKAVVDGKVPLMHLYRGRETPIVEVNEAVLKAVANQQGLHLKWPGVRVIEKTKQGAKKL